MTDVLSILGVVCVVAGVGLVSVPAALVVCGVSMLIFAVLIERGRSKAGGGDAAS